MIFDDLYGSPRLTPDARLVAEDEDADWSDRLQEGEGVVRRSQADLVVSEKRQARSRHSEYDFGSICVAQEHPKALLRKRTPNITRCVQNE